MNSTAIEVAIEVEGLGRDFKGVPAVDDLSFSVRPGEVVGLLGPNGAGKTTTVRLLNGVLRPHRGRSSVLGFDPSEHGNQVRRRTGVLTENAGLDDRLTAMENVTYPARIGGLNRRVAEKRATELLERFGMAGRANDVAQGFSTGQRKRVALARALSREPEVLFLDEPTSGLDPAAIREVLDVISSLARDHGRTVILCTHFLVEANRLCNRMAVMEQGRLLAYGAPGELAARLWEGLAVDIEVRPDRMSQAGAVLAALDGVAAENTDSPRADSLRVRVPNRESIPLVTAALVDSGIEVFAVMPQEATLEDVYFAITGSQVVEE